MKSTTWAPVFKLAKSTIQQIWDTCCVTSSWEPGGGFSSEWNVWPPHIHRSKRKTNEGRDTGFQIKHLTDWKRRWIKKLSKQTMTSAATDVFLLLRAGEQDCQEIRQEAFFSHFKSAQLWGGVAKLLTLKVCTINYGGGQDKRQYYISKLRSKKVCGCRYFSSEGLFHPDRRTCRRLLYCCSCLCKTL